MRKGLVTGLKRALLYFMLLLHIGIVNVFCYLTIFVSLCSVVLQQCDMAQFVLCVPCTELDGLSSSVVPRRNVILSARGVGRS